jgi:AraC-like DNA-binding protein
MGRHFRIPGRLHARLQEAGIRVPALLQSAGLPPGLFDQPRILVTTEELFALWCEIGRAGRASIGLALGTEAKAENFDPITLAALAAPSFGEAMRQVARYKTLSCPEEIHHETHAGEWSIHFRWLLAESPEPEVLTDLCFAWILSIARHGTGQSISPLRIVLKRPAPKHRVFERHFDCPVTYSGSKNSIIFRESDTALPFITRNAELLGMLAPQFDQELKQTGAQHTFAEGVRAAIQRKLIGGRPKMREIARELHLSSRTLQRRLQDDGFTFQQVMEQSRHQLARHYLKNSMLGLNEAAYMLGYVDSNSFVRAFRTWEGLPPAHWRELERSKTQPETTEELEACLT